MISATITQAVARSSDQTGFQIFFDQLKEPKIYKHFILWHYGLRTHLDIFINILAKTIIWIKQIYEYNSSLREVRID